MSELKPTFELRASDHPARIMVICLIAASWLPAGHLAAQADDQAPAQLAAVAARVNGREITVGDVEYQLQQALGERVVTPDVLSRLRYETLRKLVNRELVLLMLEHRNMAASEKDVDLAIQRLSEELEARERTLDDYLHELGIDQSRLRRTLRWTISWKRMLDSYMTDENLERYFEAHRRQFDGTKMRVAQIFLKAAPEQQAAVLDKARNIREEIESGAISFSQAAEQHSQAPTAQQGGDLGWIERYAPMPESFSAAAFQLEPEQISDPVTTQFGVHLIQCLEIEPGDRAWRDVRKELEPAVAQFLFQWASERQRPMANIEWLDVIKPPAEPSSAAEHD